MSLILLVIASAVSVVYQNYDCRDLFMEIQRLEMELENSEIESGQLLLEKTTLAGYGRIETTARRKIGLVQPGRESVVYLKTPSVNDAGSDD
ncbi:MAG: cell division protein FtsL [Methylococcaceae bacterium]|nr:cell division protein FtsL [Methylococcaceae bacterium]